MWSGRAVLMTFHIRYSVIHSLEHVHCLLQSVHEGTSYTFFFIFRGSCTYESIYRPQKVDIGERNFNYWKLPLHLFVKSCFVHTTHTHTHTHTYTVVPCSSAVSLTAVKINEMVCLYAVSSHDCRNFGMILPPLALPATPIRQFYSL